MSLVKWESLKDIEELFDRPLQSLSWQRLRPLISNTVFPDWNPRVDISEEDGAYLIKADVPGVPKENLRVSVQDGVLSIEGERRQETHQDGTRFHRMERCYGSFSRSFSLPTDADAAALTATTGEGQLSVRVPKKSAAPPAEVVRVPIQASNTQG